MNRQKLKALLLDVLRSLRLDNNLYVASTGAHYLKTWIRDSFYEALPELMNNPEMFKTTMQTLLDYYIKMEKKYGKFTWLIKDPNDKRGWRFPHPRCTVDLDEIPEEWGWIQLDCFGEVLYGIYLGQTMGLNIIRDYEDTHIINLIIKMLEAVKYWNCDDNAIWEENKEIHSSSVGACLAGLTAIKLTGFEVNQYLLDEAHNTLNWLLPRESVTKDVDLALLTLIYPFNIVDVPRARQIIANVEAKLLRDRGVIRYVGDQYYMRDGKEAEWCMGYGFLSLAYSTIGDFDKARFYGNLYLDKCVVEGGKIPELFYGGTDEPGFNTPLGWSNALGVIIIDQLFS